MATPLKIGRDTFYTVEEIADAYGVSDVTIRSLLREDRIVGQRIGRHWYVSERSYRQFAKKTAKLGTRGPAIGSGGRPRKRT